MTEQDAAFLEHVVKSLVDVPDAVKINRTVDEMGVLLSLDVDPNDMGKVIGRSGNTAKAIRTLLRVVGMKNNARVNLKINEPAGSTRGMGGDGGVHGGMRGSEGGMRSGSVSASTRSVDEAIEELKNS